MELSSFSQKYFIQQVSKKSCLLIIFVCVWCHKGLWKKSKNKTSSHALKLWGEVSSIEVWSVTYFDGLESFTRTDNLLFTLTKVVHTLQLFETHGFSWVQRKQTITKRPWISISIKYRFNQNKPSRVYYTSIRILTADRSCIKIFWKKHLNASLATFASKLVNYSRHRVFKHSEEFRNRFLNIFKYSLCLERLTNFGAKCSKTACSKILCCSMYMNCRLSKIHSDHTYFILRTFYFDWICIQKSSKEWINFEEKWGKILSKKNFKRLIVSWIS